MTQPKPNKKKKHKKRKKFAQELLFKIEDRGLFLSFLRLYIKINKSWKIAVSDRGRFFEIADRQGNCLKIIHKARLPFYKSGIAPRLSDLLDDYMIDLDRLQENDVFLDCGANIGEIGVGLRLAGKPVRYLAFEPGNEEHAACALNNPQATCEKSALWNETTVLEFFEKSDTADSSLIEFDGFQAVTKVLATTVDDYCAAHGIEQLRYLKIEAEGAEPEALEGASRTLARTQFVTVDCGYERGYEKESTLPRVCNHLIGAGFELVRVRKGRLIALFENTQFGTESSAENPKSV